MPLTALAATAVDQIGVPKKKQETVGHLLAYAATDSCRFVADAKAEPEVRAKQDELHPPVLDWLLETRGAALPRGARRVTRAGRRRRVAGKPPRGLRRAVGLAPRRAAVRDVRVQVAGAGLRPGRRVPGRAVRRGGRARRGKRQHRTMGFGRGRARLRPRADPGPAFFGRVLRRRRGRAKLT
mmetsp:Transcript_21700/g.66770  ORF Transcript_21700/g.66770 Transcript_21700/m.66770 type:complete len:182 (-) Transcript_21700:6-551(-)